MSKHRVDQVNDLMDRVRAHWDEIDQAASDGFERTHPIQRTQRAARQASNLHGPVHRQQVNVEEAFTHNLVAAQFTQPEAFGRKPRHRPVVRSSSAAATRHRMPPPTALGQAGLPPPTAAGQSRLPGWARQEVSYEQAIDLIEQRGRAAATHLVQSLRLGNLTKLAKERGISLAEAAASAQRAAASPADARIEPQSPTSPPPSSDDGLAPASPGPQRHPEDSVEIPASMEATSVDFVWPDQSFFMSLANGAEVVSGQGAEFIDPEATQTIVYFGRPASSA